MPNQTGTISSSEGWRSIIATPNDTITFTPASGTYSVEYPLGTLAISSVTSAQTLTLASGGHLRVLVAAGSVVFALTDKPDAIALTTDQVVATQALVSEGGIGPSSTFANLPAASEYAGMSYRVTDAGPVGAGSIWISDGIRWRVITGRALHCAASGTLEAPLATLSAAGKFLLPAGDRVSGGSIILPVGLPQIGQGVQVSAKVLHRGTAGAWNFVARLGSLDTSSDSSFMQVSGTATNDQSAWLKQDLEVVTASSFVASTYVVPNQAGAGAVVLRNNNFNNAAQLYLGLYSSALSAGDYVDLISYRVYLLG
jgi:hypothetical protein